MKKVVTIILILTCLSLVHADEKIPAEFERLKTIRDRKVEEIDRSYQRELQKLQGKYSKRGDLESAIYVASVIEEMSKKKNAVIKSTNTVAIIKCDLQFVPFQKENVMFSNRKYVWTVIPRDFEGSSITIANGGVHIPLSFEVVEPGIATILSEPEDLKAFKKDGWEECGKAHRQPTKNDTITYILQKKLEKGEYHIPTKSFLGVRIVELNDRAKKKLNK